MTAWHVPIEDLGRYARHPESLDTASASSLEQHVVACNGCRASIAAASDPDLEAASWASIAERIDAPRVSIVERLLQRVGVGEATARLVVATESLRWGWAAAVASSVAAAVALSAEVGSPGPFLVLAPLVPLLAVLAAFAPVGDPAGEVTIASPLFGPALMLRRVLLVVVPAVILVATVAAVSPHIDRAAANWLLPGLALAATAMALSTWVRLTTSASAVATFWAAGLVVMVLPGKGTAVAETLVFAAGGQIGAAAVLALALLVVATRRDRFSTMEVTW